MTTTQHTPGPWTQGDDNPLSIYGKYTNVATVHGTHATGARTEEEARANARLIAAAPDLLAALQEATMVLKWAAQESKGKVKAEIVGGWMHHAEKAQAAITAATGEEVQP
jgi:Asp/Glu/hydantoin racemase